MSGRASMGQVRQGKVLGPDVVRTGPAERGKVGQEAARRELAGVKIKVGYG